MERKEGLSLAVRRRGTPLLTLSDAQDRVTDTGPRLVRTGVSIKSGSNRKERAAGLGERSGKSNF